MNGKKKGGDAFYHERMTGREIIQLFKAGHYRADIEAGVIFNRSGQPVATYENDHGHLFIRLYGHGKRKAIAVHRVIWMVATGRAIPAGFEIHHWDADPQSNGFQNLFCLFDIDHKKIHGTDVAAELVPF